MAPGVEIRYAAADAKRQVIPWVEYKNDAKGESRTYLAEKAKADEVAALPKYTMQCVDCHNRPTHAFDSPEGAVDRALAGGRLPSSLPYIKKKSVEILKASYGSTEEAARKIPAALEDYYKQTHPGIYAERGADIQGAGLTVASLYARNVFPDLKVTWGTYPNNLGQARSRLFPLPRRGPQDQCRKDDHAGLRGLCERCVDEASPES